MLTLAELGRFLLLFIFIIHSRNPVRTEKSKENPNQPVYCCVTPVSQTRNGEYMKRNNAAFPVMKQKMTRIVLPGNMK